MRRLVSRVWVLESIRHICSERTRIHDEENQFFRDTITLTAQGVRLDSNYRCRFWRVLARESLVLGSGVRGLVGGNICAVSAAVFITSESVSLVVYYLKICYR
jgi:hypothetical protein